MATFGKCVTIALGAFVFATNAHATNPSPADVATARELYKKGADALDAGNAAGAVDKLASAWALVQTPVIGVDLSRAQTALGHLVEAREAVLSVQRLPVASDETARSKQAREDAITIAAQLEPRIPHVALEVKGLAGHDATVKLDGNVVPTAALAVSRQANPGEHVATIDSDDGRHAESRLTLAERETKTITLELAPPETRPLPIAPPPPIENPHPAVITTAAEPPPRARISSVVWVGVATAGVGIAVGAISGAFAVSEANTVKTNCTTQSPTDSKYFCLPPYTNDLSSANTFGVVSTIGFVAGGIGLAVLVAGVVLSVSHSHAPRVAKIISTLTPFFGSVSGVRGAF